MRLVVTGGGGQVAADLARVGLADPRVDAVAALTRAECDVTDARRVRAVLTDQARASSAADGLVVVNAAAWTDVDGAEAAQDAAYLVNAAGAAHVAAVCAELGATCIQLSTDYVFAGPVAGDEPDPRSGRDPAHARRMRPLEPADPCEPRSAYGRTKLAGEQAVRALYPAAHIVRTAWVYGAVGTNFVKTMARLERTREYVDVVADQVGSPTWSYDLACALVELACAPAAPAVLHVAGTGEASWYDLARAVFVELGADPDRVHPVATGAVPRPAARPAYSVLSDAAWRAAGFDPLPEWRSALSAAFRRDGSALRGLPVSATGSGRSATAS